MSKKFTKKVCCRCKVVVVVFLLIRPTDFLAFLVCRRCLALHDYIFLFEFIISILTSASLLALAKSIYFQHQLKNRIIHRKAKGSVSEQHLFVIS